MGFEGERIRPHVDVLDRYRGGRRKVERGRYRWLTRAATLILLVLLCVAGTLLPTALAPVDLKHAPGPIPEGTGPATR